MTTPITDKEPGYQHQTFLVGEDIYLRRIEKDDAKLTVSWRESLFPFAPSITETWITEELAKETDGHYAIVRKADDRIVGMAILGWGRLSFKLNVYVDPFYGELAAHWKAETFRLVIPWLIDEQHRVAVQIPIAANETVAIAALEEAGCQQTARFRERLFRDGSWVDHLRFVRLNPLWVARLGDPNKRQLERSGTGIPRPGPISCELDGDPPLNAIAVGSRVYLKPIDKDDAEELARLGRQETDYSFGHDRVLASRGNKIHTRMEAMKDKLPEFIGFAIRLRENDRTIGDCGLVGVDYLNRHAETYSWLFAPELRGEGYGSEAKQLLLRYSFETLGMHSLQSVVANENLRSAAALRKQGYQEAGRLHWIGSTNGTYTGNVVFDLLAVEWRALQPPRDIAPSRSEITS